MSAGSPNGGARLRDWLFVAAVALVAALWLVVAFGGAPAPASGSATGTGRARDIDVETVRRLIGAGELSSQEAAYYRSLSP